jgi:hypothetical protein
MIAWFVGFLFLTLLPFIIVPGEGWKILSLIVVVGLAVFIGMKIRSSALSSLKLGLWCYTFMMLGYFMYFTTLIRSNANPPIDMNNVDNPISLVEYLSREQYGSAPLLYGPHFAVTQEDVDQNDPYIKNPMKYTRQGNQYMQIDGGVEYNFKADAKMLFPRVWDNNNDQGHADFYADWLGLGRDEKTGKYEAPSFGDNINWFFSYQMSFMYWRYFLWNFAGKQNDVQGLGSYRDGNWITGIKFADDKRLGDQTKLPQTLQKNQANNKLYLLPFVLGILGCIYQYIKNRKDWIVSFLLFFFTGVAVVLYLNQPGNQPRERDYAYVGSFYAFAIWIGLAIVALVQTARSLNIQESLKSVLINGAALSFLVIFMSCFPGAGTTAILQGVIAAGVFVAATTGAVFLIRLISKTDNKRWQPVS